MLLLVTFTLPCLLTPTDVWAQSGWGDPNLTPDRVLAAFEAHAQLVNAFLDGPLRRYELE